MASEIRLLITTGDVDGIGWEVTAKALNLIGPVRGVQFVFFRHERSAKLKPKLNRRFKIKICRSLDEARQLPFDDRTLIEVRRVDSPALWVEQAAVACRDRQFAGLVTAPLSKTSIIEAGLKDIGHTEILKRLTGAKDLFMGFVGAKFCVVLVTGHEPLARVGEALNEPRLLSAIAAARILTRSLPPARAARPMALVGLNPHAGEKGLLGQEETWMAETLRKSETKIDGPLVPDAAFLPANWKRYSVYLCPYHDQGLIPFKMVHGFKAGVHLTLGLPFVRTSVDHGTAKELFGRNLAEPGSMKDALVTAVRLVKREEKIT